MTGRRRPREQVFGQLMAAWELPEPTEVHRSKTSFAAIYLDHGLRRCLTLGAWRAGLLGWTVNTFDDELNRLTGETAWFGAHFGVFDEELAAQEGRPAGPRTA